MQMMENYIYKIKSSIDIAKVAISVLLYLLCSKVLFGQIYFRDEAHIFISKETYVEYNTKETHQETTDSTYVYIVKGTKVVGFDKPIQKFFVAYIDSVKVKPAGYDKKVTKASPKEQNIALSQTVKNEDRSQYNEEKDGQQFSLYYSKFFFTISPTTTQSKNCVVIANSQKSLFQYLLQKRSKISTYSSSPKVSLPYLTNKTTRPPPKVADRLIKLKYN